MYCLHKVFLHARIQIFFRENKKKGGGGGVQEMIVLPEERVPKPIVL